MPDVKLPRYTGGYPEDAAVHVRRAVEQHTRTLRQAAAGHVAGRGLGLSADDAAAGPARHPLDRHRRGDPRPLDARLRQPRQPRATCAIRTACIGPTRSREGEHELAIVFRDHALSDLIGFHYQRSDADGGGRRFPELSARHRRSVMHSDEPALVQRHPRRRELLGALPRRRRRLPPRPVRNAARTAQDVKPVTIGEYLETLSAAATRCRTCSPAAGSATTSPSGSATRRTTPPGTRCTGRANTCVRRRRRCRCRAESASDPATARLQRIRDRAGLGRALHRRGQRLVLVVRRRSFQRPGCAVRLPVPQALAERLSAAGRHAAGGTGSADQPARPARACIRCRGRSSRSKIDGRITFFEWVNAGHYACQNERGTMAMAMQGPLKDAVFRLRPATAADPHRFRQPGARRPWPITTCCASASWSRPASSCVIDAGAASDSQPVAAVARARRSPARTLRSASTRSPRLPSRSPPGRARSISRCSSTSSCCRRTRAGTVPRARGPSA